MKIFSGKVISAKMQKTATVAVERFIAHPMYKKRIKIVKKYHVHDEMSARVGDKVRFVASRPFSKLKRWKIVEIVNTKSGSKKESNKVLRTGKVRRSPRKKRK